jgi:hypothetical protein
VGAGCGRGGRMCIAGTYQPQNIDARINMDTMSIVSIYCSSINFVGVFYWRTSSFNIG